jgi:hypothetical protein
MEHCTRSIYAGSILAMNFLAVEKTHAESGSSIFVCIKVTSNSVAATINCEGQRKDIPITWNLHQDVLQTATGECLLAVWLKEESI